MPFITNNCLCPFETPFSHCFTSLCLNVLWDMLDTNVFFWCSMLVNFSNIIYRTSWEMWVPHLHCFFYWLCGLCRLRPDGPLQGESCGRPGNRKYWPLNWLKKSGDTGSMGQRSCFWSGLTTNSIHTTTASTPTKSHGVYSSIRG